MLKSISTEEAPGAKSTDDNPPFNSQGAKERTKVNNVGGMKEEKKENIFLSHHEVYKGETPDKKVYKMKKKIYLFILIHVLSWKRSEVNLKFIIQALVNFLLIFALGSAIESWQFSTGH